MWKLINEVCDILYKMRSFEVANSTELKNKFILDYKDKRYIVSFEEYQGDIEEDIFKTIDKVIERRI